MVIKVNEKNYSQNMGLMVTLKQYKDIYVCMNYSYN